MRSTYVLGIFLLTIVFCIGVFGQRANTGQAIEVPFDFYNNEIILQVKINGQGPFNMMLDTGTDPSAVDLSTAKAIGLQVATTGHQGTGGGTDVNLAYKTKFGRLEMGGLTATDVLTLAIDLSKVSAQLGKPIHGILGQSLLANRVVQIDYRKSVVRFLARSPFAKGTPGPNTAARTTVPFRYRDNILIDGVLVNGVSMTANLDTGSNGTFHLTADAVATLGLDEEVNKATATKAVGFNGAFDDRSGTIKNVTIGGISANGAAANFMGRGTGLDKKQGGLNIGNGFLKDFVVTIDYQRKTITLERP